jgi:hypothetical protein
VSKLLANYPAAVLDYADAVAKALGLDRRRVLHAAALAACQAPPERGPISYPTLDAGAEAVGLVFTLPGAKAVEALARRHFYGQVPWLVYWSLTNRYEQTVAILRLFPPELAQLEAALLEQSREVTPPCSSTRSRPAPKPSPLLTPRRPPPKVTEGKGAKS